MMGFKKFHHHILKKMMIDVLDPKSLAMIGIRIKKGEFNFIKEYLNNIEKISKNSF